MDAQDQEQVEAEWLDWLLPEEEFPEPPVAGLDVDAGAIGEQVEAEEDGVVVVGEPIVAAEEDGAVVVGEPIVAAQEDGAVVEEPEVLNPGGEDWLANLFGLADEVAEVHGQPEIVQQILHDDLAADDHGEVIVDGGVDQPVQQHQIDEENAEQSSGEVLHNDGLEVRVRDVEQQQQQHDAAAAEADGEQQQQGGGEVI